MAHLVERAGSSDRLIVLSRRSDASQDDSRFGKTVRATASGFALSREIPNFVRMTYSGVTNGETY